MLLWSHAAVSCCILTKAEKTAQVVAKRGEFLNGLLINARLHIFGIAKRMGPDRTTSRSHYDLIYILMRSIFKGRTNMGRAPFPNRKNASFQSGSRTPLETLSRACKSIESRLRYRREFGHCQGHGSVNFDFALVFLELQKSTISPRIPWN